MNIFAETNFVIEVALEQQEVAACEVLLQLAAEQRIRLLVPAYSFVEPHETRNWKPTILRRAAS